jgi:hypothetical protein
MSEVTVKLAGGLGNYMFQIACAYAYGLKYDKKPVFTTDDSIVIHKHLNHYKNNILSQIDLVPNANIGAKTNYQEQGFHYNEIPAIDGSVYLNGYFQSDKYFKEYTNEIKNLFSYPQEIADKVINKMVDENIYSSHINTCSIHVRRGDYLNSPNHHPVQNMNYYMKAIKQMPKDSVFLIFSDDIAWCKQNFPDLPEKFKFIEGNSDFEDLLMMSRCKNNIICNSTFSWWAAWLNNNPDKKVIIPSQWFGPAYAQYNTEDLYCEGWIKI